MPGFVMLATLVALTAAVVLHARTRAQRRERRRAADDARQLSVAARAAVEDVDRFAEELDELESTMTGRRVDEVVLTSRWRARSAYAAARRTLQALTSPEQVAQVTRALEAGRYASACARARLHGRPLPAKRPPCFFNPAHGPSVRDVRWAPAGEEPREVPACRADCERIAAGARPNIRTVPVDGEPVPYWSAGPAYAPYARGYYDAWAGQPPLAG